MAGFDPGAFTTVLETVKNTAAGGYGIMYNEATWLFDRLLLISITLTGIFWALGRGAIFEEGLKMLLKVGFVYFLITNYYELSEAVIESLIGLGLLAGGSGIPRDVVEHPSSIVDLGVQVAQPVIGWVHKVSMIDFALNIFEVIIAGLCSLVIIFCFFWLALQVFVTFVEFYISTIWSILLLGFAALKHTSWISEGAIKSPMMYAIKLGTISFILSISYPMMAALEVPAPPTFSDMLGVTLGSILFMMLTLKAGTIAAGALSGSPSLSATDAAQAGVASAAVGGAGVAAGVMGGSAMYQGAKAAATQGTKLGGAMRQGAELASSVSTSSSKMGRMGDAIGGAIKGGAGYMKQGVQDSLNKVSSGISRAASEGRLGSYKGTGGQSTAGMEAQAAKNKSASEQGSKGAMLTKASRAADLSTRLLPHDSGGFSGGSKPVI